MTNRTGHGGAQPVAPDGVSTAVNTAGTQPVAPGGEEGGPHRTGPEDEADFPDGFRVALDPGARWAGDGRTTLVGGAPARVLRFTPAGRDLVLRLAGGSPVPAGAGARALARRLLDAGLAHPRPPAFTGRPACTVVIPVRNNAAGLAATLAALEATIPAHRDRVRSPLTGGVTEERTGSRGAGAGAPVEVLVVDDASADPAGHAAAGARAGATDIRRARRGGPGAARNTGWRAASAGSRFVVFLDADCEPEPGWLDRLLAHFGDGRIGAGAPRIVAGAGPGTPRWLAAFEATDSPLDLGEREATVRPGTPVAYVPTAALVVRRSALESVGGFDEALTVGEDVDLVWRLVQRGWTVRYEPRARVAHPPRPTAAAALHQR
ncbi:MAG TPA: glycosyltransferase, partial [Acidimicrobiia bacterium]|nr:glycosyltransferase [Acidimicrobiia bacterium]